MFVSVRGRTLTTRATFEGLPALPHTCGRCSANHSGCVAPEVHFKATISSLRRSY